MVRCPLYITPALQPTVGIKNALQEGRPVPRTLATLYRGLGVSPPLPLPLPLLLPPPTAHPPAGAAAIHSAAPGFTVFLLRMLLRSLPTLLTTMRCAPLPPSVRALRWCVVAGERGCDAAHHLGAVRNEPAAGADIQAHNAHGAHRLWRHNSGGHGRRRMLCGARLPSRVSEHDTHHRAAAGARLVLSGQVLVMCCIARRCQRHTVLLVASQGSDCQNWRRC